VAAGQRRPLSPAGEGVRGKGETLSEDLIAVIRRRKEPSGTSAERMAMLTTLLFCQETVRNRKAIL
jgi:hypothetical protein